MLSPSPLTIIAIVASISLTSNPETESNSSGITLTISGLEQQHITQAISLAFSRVQYLEPRPCFLLPHDSDDNRRVDLLDWGRYQNCIGKEFRDWSTCSRHDINGDGSIDRRDYMYFIVQPVRYP